MKRWEYQLLSPWLRGSALNRSAKLDTSASYTMHYVGGSVPSTFGMRFHCIVPPNELQKQRKTYPNGQTKWGSKSLAKRGQNNQAKQAKIAKDAKTAKKHDFVHFAEIPL